jgi:hypothetical protein
MQAYSSENTFDVGDTKAILHIGRQSEWNALGLLECQALPEQAIQVHVYAVARLLIDQDILAVSVTQTTLGPPSKQRQSAIAATTNTIQTIAQFDTVAPYPRIDPTIDITAADREKANLARSHRSGSWNSCKNHLWNTALYLPNK